MRLYQEFTGVCSKRLVTAVVKMNRYDPNDEDVGDDEEWGNGLLGLL